MAARYYDDIIIEKLKAWTPSKSKLRVLGVDETTRLFETLADDSGDKKVSLPMITLSRSNDITLKLNIKNPMSYDGAVLSQSQAGSYVLNGIPITLNYQLDIYAKKFEQADEYLREYLFKLINNPKLIIDIPYNGQEERHVAYIRLSDSVSNTSDISQHLFPGQFTRWTVQFEIQDAYLFSIPYKSNWKLVVEDTEIAMEVPEVEEQSGLELSEAIDKDGELEAMDITIFK